MAVPQTEHGDFRSLWWQPWIDPAISDLRCFLKAVFADEGRRFLWRLASADDRLGPDHLPLRHVFTVPDQDLSVGSDDHVE